MLKNISGVKMFEWFILQCAQTLMHCGRCCGKRGMNSFAINKGNQGSRLRPVEFPVGIAVVAPIAGIDNVNRNVKVAPVDG